MRQIKILRIVKNDKELEMISWLDRHGRVAIGLRQMKMGVNLAM